ncbi:MAG: PQQ-binding-like beta-propeller repeat protein, partial [Lentisphaeria bacterium]|nr:PQQ-binding-like beta-propeller repeat protein [Lentisphaeria bacterium]
EYRESHDLRSGTVLHEAPLCPAWPNWHHHRCYRDKATVRYILAGRTGIEFIDLRTGEVQLHNWVRGSCKFGILPAHGLLTLPPEQCGCYIESKLTGFHALAAERPHMTGLEDAHPLEREPDIPGPANAASRARLPPLSPEDWPVYRHDTRRTGATPMAAPNDLEEAWRVLLGGRLTPPVAAHGLLLTAQIDTHTLHALDARTGARLWEFVAGGRIDSPPALAGGLAVFGCHDGWIYALHAADGRLCWRFRAAPAPHRLVDDGRLESVWPAHGSVLVQDGTVFYAAGRSSYVDGGIRMGTLSLPTGEPGIARTFYSRDPATGDAVTLYTPFSAEGPLGKMEMPGVLPDVLSSDGECLWMRSVTFNRALEIQPSFPPHLFSSMGFLDDSGWELSYWLYGPHMYSGRAGIAHAVTLYPTARIMVCGEDEVYGYQYGYEGIAAPRFIASAKVPVTRTVKLKKGSRSQVVHRWETRVPLHVQALVLAAHTLFLAGTPEVDTQATRLELEAVTTDEYHPSPVLRKALDTFLGRHGGVLVALDAADGTPRLERRLDVLPVFDGLIAANGSLYMSCRDGHVVCLRGKQPPQMNPPRP